jgi:hypothetical protein
MPLGQVRMGVTVLGAFTTGGGRLMNEPVVALLPVALLPKPTGFVVLIPGVVVGIPGVVVGMPGVTEPVMGVGVVRPVLGVVMGGRLLLGTSGKPRPRTCPGARVPVAVLPIAVLPVVVCASAAPASAADDAIHRIRAAARMAKSPLG